jgi:hypothetical protein
MKSFLYNWIKEDWKVLLRYLIIYTIGWLVFAFLKTYKFSFSNYIILPVGFLLWFLFLDLISLSADFVDNLLRKFIRGEFRKAKFLRTVLKSIIVTAIVICLIYIFGIVVVLIWPSIGRQ